MAEVAFRPARQLSEYKGKGASASRELKSSIQKENAQWLTKSGKVVFCLGKSAGDDSTKNVWQ